MQAMWVDKNEKTFNNVTQNDTRLGNTIRERLIYYGKLNWKMVLLNISKFAINKVELLAQYDQTWGPYFFICARNDIKVR